MGSGASRHADAAAHHADAAATRQLALLRGLVHGRRSARRFDADAALPRSAVQAALELAQRAPSAFNLQPYRVVVVRDALARKQLAHCMVGGNIRRVGEAPATAVFLADLQPWRLIPRLVDLERSAGVATEAELSALASNASFFLGGMGATNPDETTGATSTSAGAGFESAASPLLGRLLQQARGGAGSGSGSGCGARAEEVELQLKRAAMSLVSHVTQTPTLPSSLEAWAVKNAMLAAQNYMLALAAQGYDACPMEGFDARRVKDVLSVPQDRFSVPVIIPAGVELLREEQGEGQGEGAEEGARVERPRFAFEDVFSQDTLDFPLYREDDDSAR